MLGPHRLTFSVPVSEVSKETHALTCYEWGDASNADTVLCVHGLTRNGRDFDALAQGLAVNYRVLCPDMPGRGESGYLRDASGYTNPAYLADILFMLQELNVPRVRWVGTSMGGILGLMMAATKPGLVSSLLLNDIGCLIQADALKRIRANADFGTRFDSYAEAEALFRKRCEPFGISSESQWQHLLKFGIVTRNDKFFFTYDPAIFSAGFSKDAKIEDISLWPLWEKIVSLPIMLMRGENSDILSVATAREMQATHEGMTFHEVKDTGHAPALMDLKQITPILDWMSATSII